MSLLAPPAALDRAIPLAARLAELAVAQRLEAIVLCGDAGALRPSLAACGLPMWAIDPRPGVVAALQQAGDPRLRCVQGAPGRVLTDLRRQIPRRSLFVFAPAGLPAGALREALFQVPRGEGVVAVLPPTTGGAASRHSVADQLLRWSPDHHVERHPTADGGVALVAVPQPRVHVTFLIEKYTHEYGASGISINLDNLVATLDQTGCASWNVVHYDECFHEGRALTPAMLAPPAGTDVHVLACTLHYHSRANPSVALLRQAKAAGSRIVYFWLDKKISQGTPDYYEIADVNVVLDGNDFELPNSWPIFTPKNPRVFHDPGLERDIGISLVGEVRYLSQRKAIVERLQQEQRVHVQMFGTSAADTARTLSVEEYARLYKRSKISLAMTKDSVRQLKGRVFEIVHCGALLLCDHNHHVDHYFEPGVEYATYRDYEDLVRQARYYLDHDDERRAIAAAGHRRAVAYYSHDVFWRSLLARVGASAAGVHERER